MIGDLFADAGLAGHVHAIDLDGPGEVAFGDPDELVVQASVFKIPILVEVVRQGGLTDPVVLPAAEPRTPGPIGTSQMRDEVTMSVRDLALLMMSVSDNHATDVLLARVGLDAVNATMREAGFPGTQLAGDCAYLWATMEEDLGVPYLEFTGGIERIRAMRAVTPAETTHTTPRETTGLLAALWRDERFDPAVCAEARRILALQPWPHRLTAGFPDDAIAIAGKTGTIAHLRCEAGVVEHPDGHRAAVAVFVDCPTAAARNPPADRLIGDAAAAAVAALRGG